MTITVRQPVAFARGSQSQLELPDLADEIEIEYVGALEQFDSFGGSLFYGATTELMDSLGDGWLHDGLPAPHYTGPYPRTAYEHATPVGIGAAGFGTMLAYADAISTITGIDPRAYSDRDLAARADELRFVVRNYHRLRFDLADFFHGHIGHDRFADRLALLEADQCARESLPHDHPAREGRRAEAAPLVLELEPTGLLARPTRSLRSGKSFGGETCVMSAIDLRSRLRRVYCPQRLVNAVVERWPSRIEVIAMESLVGLAETGVVETTRRATYDALASLEITFQHLISAYAAAITSERVVNDRYIMENVWVTTT